MGIKKIQDPNLFQGGRLRENSKEGGGGSPLSSEYEKRGEA